MVREAVAAHFGAGQDGKKSHGNNWSGQEKREVIELVKKYFSCETMIIPFSKILGVVARKTNDLDIYVGSGTGDSGFYVSFKYADRFISEYEAWLNAQ